MLVDCLFGLTGVRGLSLDAWMAEFREEVPSGFLIIGGDPGGGFFILDTQPGRGGVYYWDHQHFFHESSKEEGKTFLLAESFASWLDSLQPTKHTGC